MEAVAEGASFLSRREQEGEKRVERRSQNLNYDIDSCSSGIKTRAWAFASLLGFCMQFFHAKNTI